MALATWRLAYMLTYEMGPWGVFERLRGLTTLGGLLVCVYCTSVWAALALWVVWGTPARPLVYVLAVSGAGLMLASYTGVHHL